MSASFLPSFNPGKPVSEPPRRRAFEVFSTQHPHEDLPVFSEDQRISGVAKTPSR
ncbi:hypothetical protein RSSM_01904 [Rhodopirellula sallentina SM41]|uniref:Uncharacterized protein n=1 Tax=Rhodopirellula sallentina SM41 TaxID=1263870 RepID=M5U5C6_9BACT|nr:hypothetical protein RSSM_01904 [Rhodopirellula sallentina SM41]